MITGPTAAGFSGSGGGGCESPMIVSSLLWAWTVCPKEPVEGAHRVSSRWRGGLWGS